MHARSARSWSTHWGVMVCLASALACTPPKIDPRGKLCDDLTCPAGLVCGLKDGGGPPVCEEPFAKADHCAQDPGACGFPDDRNVGVPRGTVLKKVPSELRSGDGWSWQSGTVYVITPDAVVSGLDIAGSVEITVPGVTLSNSRVQTRGDDTSGVTFLSSARDGTVVDSEVGGLDSDGGTLDQGINCEAVSACTVLRANILHTRIGVRQQGGVVQDTYVHAMSSGSQDNAEGLLSVGAGGLSAKHNTVLVDVDGICGICLLANSGPQANDQLSQNLVGGGNYCFYGGSQVTGGGDTHDIRVTDNRWSVLFSSMCGSYGLDAHYSLGDDGNQATGNVWDDSGKPANDL